MNAVLYDDTRISLFYNINLRAIFYFNIFTFDFIFIDGRARVECIKKAITLLSDNGVICLHDANRLEYKEYVSTIPSTFIFNDWRKKSGGFWLMSKSPELIQKCINTQHYSDLFSIYTIVGRRIKV